MEQIKDDAVFCSQQELPHKYAYIRCYYLQNKQKAEKLVLKGKVSVKFKTLDFYQLLILCHAAIHKTFYICRLL